jgi:hypothetical protein
VDPVKEPSSGHQLMKIGLLLGSLTLLLVGCHPSDPCRLHTEQASCGTDNACVWNSDSDKCKTAKKVREPAAVPEATPVPAPAEPPAAAPSRPQPPIVEPAPTPPMPPAATPEATPPPEPSDP